MGSRLEDSYRDRIASELAFGWNTIPEDMKPKAMEVLDNLRQPIINYKIAATESAWDAVKGILQYFAHNVGVSTLLEATRLYGQAFVIDEEWFKLPLSTDNCYTTFNIGIKQPFLGASAITKEGFLSEDGVPLDYGSFYIPHPEGSVYELSMQELISGACSEAVNRYTRRLGVFSKISGSAKPKDIIEAYTDKLAGEIIEKLHDSEGDRVSDAFNYLSKLVPGLVKLYATSNTNPLHYLRDLIPYFSTLGNKNNITGLLKWIIDNAKWYPVVSNDVLIIPLNTDGYLAAAAVHQQIIGISFRVVPLDTVVTYGYMPRDSASCFIGYSTDTCHSKDPEEILGNLADLAEKRVEVSEKEERRKEELLKGSAAKQGDSS
jgi:hypothetical protein